jgi:hypothetical protein
MSSDEFYQGHLKIVYDNSDQSVVVSADVEANHAITEIVSAAQVTPDVME